MANWLGRFDPVATGVSDSVIVGCRISFEYLFESNCYDSVFSVSKLVLFLSWIFFLPPSDVCGKDDLQSRADEEKSVE